MKDFPFPKKMPAAQRKKLAAIYGQLRIRYTRSHGYSSYKGCDKSDAYEVLASDSDSVAILTWHSFFNERRIYHIHFDGADRYWIDAWGHVEWFRRVKATTTKRTPRGTDR